MKRRDLVNLLNRAAAALETPEDLTETGIALLIEDLCVAARELEDQEEQG